MVSLAFDPAAQFGEAPSLSTRVERALSAAIDLVSGAQTPPRLAAALRYAVFPGGARVRPTLCLLAALASGDADPIAADAAAAAIELLHCASLVHDDLPSFDNADRRRGKASVHKVFGEALAVLTGDGLIMLAFEVLARTATDARSVCDFVAELACAAGASRGLVAGQAWESEHAVSLEAYHRAKTASLFEAACAMGAAAGGGDAESWRPFGDAIGHAYQAADDLRDATGTAARLGKPAGRDAALSRPSLVRACGVDAARLRVSALLDMALDLLPACVGERRVRAWVADLADELQ